jgi:hypothetical protein
MAAREELEKARVFAARLNGREFSCWRYLEVNRSQMREDLNAMERFFDGESSGPLVFSRASEQPEDPRLLN